MKKIVTIALCLFTAAAFAQTQTAAPVITFKDGSTHAIKGSLVGVLKELNEGKESKTIKTYYHRQGDSITVSFFKEWIAEKQMDELKVYHFHKNLIKADDFGEVTEQDSPTFVKGKFFGTILSATEGKEFEYDVYSIWEGKPEKRSFSMFSIEDMAKEALEKLVADIKTVLPKAE